MVAVSHKAIQSGAALSAVLLTPAWKPLKPHGKQISIWNSNKRFIIAVAGRRSGKSIIAKRKLVLAALLHDKPYPGKYIYCAPTRDQAKDIAWKDSGESIREHVPLWAIRDINESDLTITLLTGTRIVIVGMDKPQRAEGTAIDGVVLDEYADMKEEAWSRSISPSLSTLDREGWAMFIGKPKGRNHFWKLWEESLTGKDALNWFRATWPSSDILSATEIESARARLDELSYNQEYNASFVNFAGRAYYQFSDVEHTELGITRRYYNKQQPLNMCFDFNVAPGVAAVNQEILHHSLGEVTGWMGEVWIPQNSTTPAVCRKLIKDWGKHEGLVYAYGDATGGAQGSAKIAGSDWDMIKDIMRAHFGERFRMRVDKENPRERVRVNALNARLKTHDGKIHSVLDKARCKMLAVDLDGVLLLKGGSGELDKGPKADPERTHISDAAGYYVAKKHPVHRLVTTQGEIF